MCTSYGRNRTTLFNDGTGGNAGAPSFGDITTVCASGFGSRPGSSQQNGEILASLSCTTTYPLRPAYPLNTETSTDNASFYNSTCFNGAPPRNMSEPSFFPSLSASSRTVGTDLSGGRILTGNSAKPLNAASNTRTPGNLFNSNDPGSNSSSMNSSSRGITLDPADFPPILTSAGTAGSPSLPANLYSTYAPPLLRNYVSVMSKGSCGSDANIGQVNQFAGGTLNQATPPEFSKQDFPALPGSSQPAPSTGNSLTVTNAPPNQSAPSLYRTVPGSSITPSLNSHRSLGQMHGPVLNAPPMQSTSSSVPLTHPDSTNALQLLPNHLVTNIPKNMIQDQFGMLGLLKLIHVGDHDSTMNLLAPGLDLSLLHNNWQIPGELHRTFITPLHEACVGRPHDLSYPVPPEYLLRSFVAERLPDPPVDQLADEILFWLFYNCCREEMQLVVAKELYQREWRYHKKEQIWLTRIIGGNFTTDNASEQGDYYFWDPIKAQKSTQKMKIYYSDLDNAPAAFQTSTNTLNASVNIGGGSSGPQLSLPSALSHSNLQQQHQQQLAMYQQQQQQQQQYSRQYQQQSSVVGTAIGQVLSHGGNNSLNASAASAVATWASFLSARNHHQQQQHKQTQQSNAPANFFQASGLLQNRSNSFNQRLIAPSSDSLPTTVSVSFSSSNAINSGSTIFSTVDDGNIPSDTVRLPESAAVDGSSNVTSGTG